jgi:tetratricopeptide (TPR) repeat protein
VAAQEAGDLRRAHEEFERVAAAAPDFAPVHYYRAVMREGPGDLDGALAMYRRAIAADPNDYRALFNLAVILIDERRDHAAGVEALRQAVRSNPELGRAHIYLGRSLVFLANPASYAEAERVLLRGLELQPTGSLLPMAHLTLAELYRRTGRSADAQRHQMLGERAQRGG